MSEPYARIFVGAISGTSVDGLDLALISLNNDSSAPDRQAIQILKAQTVSLPESLRTQLLSLGQPGNDDLDLLGSADTELGRFTGQAIRRLLADTGIAATRVTAIGSHGQTVRHRPDAEHAFTWQIGDPNTIAEVTGITTVADFRRRDMAAGGQGAPLVPAFHEALFRTPEESRVVLNIGGISNITRLHADPSVPVSGFDTGPGNALMDAWTLEHTGRSFDEDGAWAASGSLDEALLDALLTDPYLSRPPPKSTGREVFNLRWLAQYPAADTVPVNIQRTLLEYTGRTVIDAIEAWASPCQRLIICGGGRLNGQLLGCLRNLSDWPVSISEDHGFDGDAIEAAAFGWLAARRLAGQPGNSPSVTGARGGRILGAVYPP